MSIKLNQHTLFFRSIFFQQIFYYIIIVLAPPAWAEKKSFDLDVPSYTTLMTDNLNKKTPIKKFSCSNPVYLYFTWYLLKGRHQINTIWINPQGKEENQAQLEFIAEKPKINNWVALEFKNNFNRDNLLIPNLKAFKFIGKWKVHIFLDRKLLETLDFFVYCE